MGCQMLAALDSSSANGHEKLARVPAWFEAWEQCLSRFRADSELNRLNRSPDQPVQVSEVLWEVFQVAQRAAERSSGLVTPLVYGALVAAGYDRSFELLEGYGSADLHDEVPIVGRLESITSDRVTRSINLPAGTRLDFGGVAKGWAAHQAMQRLKPYGPALVDAGGDIAISGLQSDGRPWTIGIADPFQPDTDASIALLGLGRSGLATSGKDFRRWQQGGQTRHHIIDPRTGRPADTDILAATVVAPTVIEAETAAKTVLILGSKHGMAWLESQNKLAGFLALDNGSKLLSRNMDRYLWS